MVNLKANPFFLDEEAVGWVEKTLARMTLREKLCQLFLDPLTGKSPEEVLEFLKTYPLGGAPLRTMVLGNDVGQALIAEIQRRIKQQKSHVQMIKSRVPQAPIVLASVVVLYVQILIPVVRPNANDGKILVVYPLANPGQFVHCPHCKNAT